MSTRFVLRSPYLQVNRSICRLDARSPLDWFRSVWSRLRQDATITSKALLGVEQLYGFKGFADHVRYEELAAPMVSDHLQTLLTKNWHSNDVKCRDGFVLIKTDGDEVELAFWWVSEEVFLAKQEVFACYATLLRRLAEVDPESASRHSKKIYEGTLSENELRRDVRWLGSKQPTSSCKAARIRSNSDFTMVLTGTSGFCLTTSGHQLIRCRRAHCCGSACRSRD